MCERLNIWILGGHIARNVALQRPTAQSSERNVLLYPSTADKAVDGNRDPADKGTCTLTNSESSPWWRVDLQEEYKIDAIAITSIDDHQITLDGAEIWIGISEGLNNTKNIRCAVISSFPEEHTLYIPCSGFGGRYVIVLLPGHSRELSLCEVEVYPVDFAYPLPNVALKGEATQSSTLSVLVASKAIDGKRNSMFQSGSCSHTSVGVTDPWWRVDLRRTFIITAVKITNRGDCCPERLDGAEIRIGNSPENNGNNNPRCAIISHIRAGHTFAIHCERGSMAGRFVNIIIPGTKKTLGLCEVEVYGAPEQTPLQNVALRKPATWSAESRSNESPSNAVSGCRNINYADCRTSIPPLSQVWWEVDLLALYNITAITVIIRQTHLKETQVFIRNPGIGNNKCAHAAPLQNTLTHTFHCDGMVGRYVRLQFPYSITTVTLCEVEVYAVAADEEPVANPDPTDPPLTPPSLTMTVGGRTVTLVGERLCWSDALLYCRRHHWDLLSLHSKEEQTEVAQVLNRATFILTDGVWLGLRKYIMGKTWFWMSGASLGFSHWSHHSVPHQYSSPCGSMAMWDPHQWVDRSCDQHLHFICQSRGGLGSKRVLFNSYII